MMRWPAGYLITFTCYGERFHGDERGSVERVRYLGMSVELEPDQHRVEHERHWLKGRPNVSMIDGDQSLRLLFRASAMSKGGASMR